MKRTQPRTDAASLRRGFTLVEMMIVVAIIAILAAFLAPSVSRYIHRSKGMSSARVVVNALRRAQNQALSRGEVILATVSTYEDANLPAASGGRIQLFRTNNENTSGCTPDSIDPDCYARTCAQAQGMSRVKIDESDFMQAAPDMIIAGMDPSANAGTRTICFSPSGRVLEMGGQPIEPTGSSCDGLNARIFVRAEAEGDVFTNPLYPGGPNLDDCVDISDGSDEALAKRQNQKDGRDVANFYAVYISFNGAITLKQ